MPAPNLDELGVQFTNNPDGTAELKMPTGEVFKGSKDEVIAHLAKSKVETRKYADDYKSKYETTQQEYQTYQQQHQQPAPQPQITGELAEQMRLGGYMGDSLAKKYLGPNATGDQLMQMITNTVLQNAERNKEYCVLEFQRRCKDFPNNDEASNSLETKIAEEYGITDWDAFAKNDPKRAANLMVAAHHVCVAEGIYKPLTDEQVRAASDAEALEQQRGQRPPAPPLVRGGNPEQQTQQNDPWGMNLADLRNAAIRQQLGDK